MTNRRKAILAGLLALLLVAVAACSAMSQHDQPAGAMHHAPSRFADVSDRTNRESAERMRHAGEKARSAEVIAALASLREAGTALGAAGPPAPEIEELPQEAPPADRAGSDAYGAGAPRTGEGGADGFRSAGVLYGDDGTRFTWYSQRTLPGAGLAELNANGRHVDGRGYVVDGDGYIALASGSHDMGEVVETPVGTGKVYDFCPTPGTVDVYTDF